MLTQNAKFEKQILNHFNYRLRNLAFKKITVKFHRLSAMEINVNQSKQ